MRFKKSKALLALSAALAAAVCGHAMAADEWPGDSTTLNPIGTGNVAISNQNWSDQTLSSDANDLVSWENVMRGGAGQIIMPDVTNYVSGGSGTATTLTLSGTTVNNNITTITSDGSFDTNAFGPLVVFGSYYAATATNMTGYDSDGNSQTFDYVTDLTSVSINGLSMSGNKTNLLIGDAYSAASNSSAFGGAARLANLPDLVYDGGTIEGNILTIRSTTTSADMASVHANGGGIALESDFGTTAQLKNLTFTGNQAVVDDTTGSGTSTNARGGALYVAGYNAEKQTFTSTAADNTGLILTVTGTRFTSNTASNTTGAAAGGAVFTNVAVSSTFKDVRFSGNTAKSTSGNALGGAVAMVFDDYYSGGGYSGAANGTLAPLTNRVTGTTHTYFADFNDTTFSNNTVQGNTAAGGAIYTDRSILVSNSTFTGNRAVDAANDYTNAIHLANASTNVIFYDADGVTSTDNDGITGAGNIIKEGTGDLALLGMYGGTGMTNTFDGNILANAGAIHFKGGDNQVFTSGSISVASGATISLEKYGTGTVTANTITAANGSKVVAKVLQIGNGTMNNNETAHFVGTSSISADSGATYLVAGKMRTDEQYIILTETGATLDNTTSTQRTVQGAFNDYIVHENATGDAVWAEMIAGTGRTLGGYATTTNNRNLLNAVEDGSKFGNWLDNNFLLASDAGLLNRAAALATGEVAASTNSALIGYSAQTANMILSQSRAAWMTDQPDATSGYGYAAVRCLSSGPRIWAELDGFYSKGRDTNDTYRAKTRSYGVSLGLDSVMGDWLIGAGFRYGDGRLKVDALRSRSDFDSYSVSVYAGRRIVFNPGTLYLTAGYSFGYHDIDGRRNDIANGTYKSSYHGRSHTTYLDAEFDFANCNTWKIAPFANVMYNSYRNNSFTEREYGGVSGPLHVSARTKANVSTTLGMRVKADVSDSVFFDAEAGWRHTYGNITVSNRTNFVGGSQRFSVIGNALARDEAVYGAGIGFKLSERAMLRASYDGSYGDKTYSHQGTVSLSLWF